MTDSKARVLVHGATGFTGQLVCHALAKRGIPFAVSGRRREALERLVSKAGAADIHVVDVKDAESIAAALEGKTIVLACAGPFVEVGEAVLASCARRGIHYADTTGEQRFVIDAKMRYGATAEAKGACVVPAMAYEIAIADWASSLVTQRIGGAPDEINILYAVRTGGGGGYGTATSRGTKLSALRMSGDPEPKQFVNGALATEPTGEVVRSFTLPSGKEVWAVSFPSPEAVCVPIHSKAQTVRTFMAVGKSAADLTHLFRHVVPTLARTFGPMLARRIAKGPEEASRESTFVVVAEAIKDGKKETVSIVGKDPYGLTAEVQAYAASCALENAIHVRGVGGPAFAFDAEPALAELQNLGFVSSVG